MSITKRIDNITNIPDEYRAVDPPCPPSVKIELTARCNFSCAFCARSDKLRDQGDMDFDLYKRLLEEMRGKGVEEIGLFYLGESFLVPWLEQAIKFAKKIGYPYIFLTTNGSLATPERVSRCIMNGLDSLKFSLNYSDRDQFSDVARVKPKLFDVMVANIKSAKFQRDHIYQNTGIDCCLYASYIEYDGEQGEKMKPILDEITPYVDELYALPLYSQAALKTEEAEKRDWDISLGNTGRAGAQGRVGGQVDPIPCWALFREGHITYDGKLSACCFDHDGRFHMGDLKKEPFMSAWHSEKFKELRKQHLDGTVKDTVCEICVAYQ
jgi:radical SAM protein with 4Fe4S-binding SPASM domain